MSLGAYHHNRVRTLIRDPLVSLFDLMNTCILNPYISQGLRLLLCCIMQWLVDCVFHLEFYLIGYICNQRKQLWLVTDASKAKYLPNKKTLFSISISIQLNSSSLNRSCSFISVRGERDRIWLSIPALKEMVPCKRNSHAYIWKRTAVLPIVQICFICPVRSQGLCSVQPASCKLSVRFSYRFRWDVSVHFVFLGLLLLNFNGL